MKANELRIGNWVMGNKPFQLTLNDFGRISAHLSATNEMRFEPIPLTEDWLEKFGFTFEYDNWSIENGWCISAINGAFCTGAGTEYEHNRIKYVHSLQNLYFALTNEELTIQQ